MKCGSLCLHVVKASVPMAEYPSNLMGLLVMQDIQLGAMMALLPLFGDFSHSSSHPYLVRLLIVLQTVIGVVLMLILAKLCSNPLMERVFRFVEEPLDLLISSQTTSVVIFLCSGLSRDFWLVVMAVFWQPWLHVSQCYWWDWVDVCTVHSNRVLPVTSLCTASWFSWSSPWAWVLSCWNYPWVQRSHSGGESKYTIKLDWKYTLW